jgi:hypothetical protein
MYKRGPACCPCGLSCVSTGSSQQLREAGVFLGTASGALLLCPVWSVDAASHPLLRAGAYGATISGAGPTAVAIVDSEAKGQKVRPEAGTDVPITVDRSCQLVLWPKPAAASQQVTGKLTGQS